MTQDRTQLLRAFERGLIDPVDLPFALTSSERLTTSAKRRIVARELLFDFDYAPQQWSDYRTLLKFDIESQVIALKRKFERHWTVYLKDERLQFLEDIYLDLLESGRGKPMRSGLEREIWLRGIAVSKASDDCAALGLIEEVSFGFATFGTPPDSK